MIASETDTRPQPARPAWDGAWPVKGPELLRLLIAYVSVVAIGTLVGLIFADWTAPNALTRLDERTTDAFVDSRTDLLTDLSPWAAGLSDTIVKIALSTVICLALLWIYRRWDDAVYVALPLVFEAMCFITITYLVQRPRPDVDRLQESPVNSSFPSGHVAAATVYAAIVVLVWRHTRSRPIRLLTATLLVAVVAAVSWARLYQGMHFLTDVVAGVVLGVISVLITDRVLDTSRLRPRGAAAES